MKTLTIFEASDGSRFNSPSKCQEHENLIVALNEAILPLGEEWNIKSEQFFQHDKEAALQAKRNVMAIVRARYGTATYPVMGANPDEIHPRSVVGRIIADKGPTVLNYAWSRLSRINWDNFREYEQPYFAANPDKATQEIG